MYYALRRLKILKKDGEYEFREPGAAIPEAYDWKELPLRSMLKVRHIEYRDDKDEAKTVVESKKAAPSVKKAKKKKSSKKKTVAKPAAPKEGQDLGNDDKVESDL